MIHAFILALAPPPMTTEEIIADLVKNQFVFSGETDDQQKERAKKARQHTPGGRTR